MICYRVEKVAASGSSSSEEDADDEDFLLFTPSTCRKIRPSNIISPELASAFDQSKIIDKNATNVL